MTRTRERGARPTGLGETARYPQELGCDEYRELLMPLGVMMYACNVFAAWQMAAAGRSTRWLTGRSLIIFT